ncbi:MAG TPA: response regulator transcription factor [Armatimonadota bacterium]|nr:response regulator transcription factor [Armatimonadota bacterium]
MRILLVEDDEAIADMIRRGLEEDRYDVDVVGNGILGFKRASEGAYGLLILDIMLPGIDGITLCKMLRGERVSTPVLMLTARDTVEDKVKGLESGADDYLPKPFNFTELRARVRALLRRMTVHKERVIRVADLEIDTAARRVTRGGDEIVLTRREYELLEALATNEGRVLTRDLIRDEVWMEESGFSNTVDVRIGLLRKKIDSGREPKLIHTIHGIGYSLRIPSGEGH